MRCAALLFRRASEPRRLETLRQWRDFARRLHIAVANTGVDLLLLPNAATATVTATSSQQQQQQQQHQGSNVRSGAARLKAALQPQLASVFLATAFFHGLALLPVLEDGAEFSLAHAKRFAAEQRPQMRGLWSGSLDESLLVLDTHSYLSFCSRFDLRHTIVVSALSSVIAHGHAAIERFYDSVPTPAVLRAIDGSSSSSAGELADASQASGAATAEAPLPTPSSSDGDTSAAAAPEATGGLELALESIEGPPQYRGEASPSGVAAQPPQDDRLLSRTQFYLRALQVIVFQLPPALLESKLLPMLF